MFKVTYTERNEKGYLIDMSKNFDMLQEAFVFIREIRANSRLVGKPIIERF